MTAADRRKRAEEMLRTQKYAPDADLVSPVVDAMLAFADECAAEIQKELDAMRVLAAAPQATQAVHDAFGTLSLWTQAGLQRKIDECVKAERERCEKLALDMSSEDSETSGYAIAAAIREGK